MPAAFGPCDVTVSASRVKVSIRHRTCNLPPETSCAAVCAVPRVTCTIPALAAGTYALELDSTVKASDDVTRQIVVEDGATATSCTLDQGGPKPQTISSGDYPRSCSGDEQCALVHEGNACDVCPCQNAAVLATALSQYQADLREKAAQCESIGTPSCAPCESKVAKCVQGKCAAVTGP